MKYYKGQTIGIPRERIYASICEYMRPLKTNNDPNDEKLRANVVVQSFKLE